MCSLFIMIRVNLFCTSIPRSVSLLDAGAAAGKVGPTFSQGDVLHHPGFLKTDLPTTCLNTWKRELRAQK